MQALEQAVAVLEQQGFDQAWAVDDDLCDCTFQRMGSWYNPYLGERLDVRVCCIWAEIYKAFPQFVKVTRTEPAEWNGETDMPRGLWHRQLARIEGSDVATARVLGFEPPKGRPKTEPRLLYLKWGSEWLPLEMSR